MDSLRRERRQAYCEVFRCLVRSGVLDPFPGMGYYGLSGRYIERSTFVLHVKLPPNHNCVLFELRRLARLLPPGGAAHVRYADSIVFRIHAANKFVNDLRHVAGCLNASGIFNVSRQIGLQLPFRLTRFLLETGNGKVGGIFSARIFR